jgi:peptide deformylase
MAILKIARMGHPVLKARAAEIEDPGAPEVAALIADMLETMADAEGLGLAAPQVHVSKRLVIFRIPPSGTEDDDRDDAEDFPVLALINPVVEPLTDDLALGWEGCLSVPGLRGLVPRFTEVRYTGVTAEGTPIETVAEGLHARVVQHECDHLDGVLYPMQMDDLSMLVFESEWKHRMAAEQDTPKADPAAETDDQDVTLERAS